MYIYVYIERLLQIKAVTFSARRFQLEAKSPTGMQPFDLLFDVDLYLPAETVIGLNKSRDLFKPITFAACKNK